ncbi:Two component system response regulator/histidine kinase, CheW domain-containing [Desulfonema limicola]|uniref:histidine kinase n=1 Tax=Desulfonema limicola TaxID=45656 RepID=A0A975GKE2_9BACT|nr:chemotaxis protein CheW [Desulfonema limicola]QTA83713.1 Two component system response regulator/histidine kinase, CheW domain-containing [Desulfonema limicola]
MAFDIKKIKIILAEDSSPVRKLEVLALKKLGFENIIEAENGDDAVEKLLKNLDTGLIISDWNMPEKDGYSLLTWARSTETFKDIPFLMATAQSDRQQIRRAVRAGVSGFIAKPFEADELNAKIEEIFNIKKEDIIQEKKTDLSVTSSGKIRLKIAHIQITDHLILGVLRHLIDTGELVPQNFELETVCMPGWNPVEQALEQGIVDGACVLAPIAMDLFAYGVPIRLVLLAHRNGSIFVRNVQDRENVSLKEFFQEKYFLIPHKMSVHHMLAHKYFSDLGLKAGVAGEGRIDVQFEVVAPIMMGNFLRDNPRVSGFMVAEPLGTRAIASGIAELQFLSVELWDNHPCCVVAVQDDFINKHEAAMYEFIEMFVYAGKRMEQDPGMAAEIGTLFLDPKQELGLTSSLLKEVLQKSVRTDDLFPVIGDLARIQQYMFMEMNIGKLIDLNKFIDNRFAQRACKKESQLPEPGLHDPVSIKEDEHDLEQDVSDTIRISVEILDQLMAAAGELVLIRNQERINTDYSDPAARSLSQRLDIVTTEIQEAVLLTRMQPVNLVFTKFQRLVRDLGKQFKKNISISFKGSSLEIDKSILESLPDPLTRIIHNCCEHGIESPGQRQKDQKPETGMIEVHAHKKGGQLHLSIQDDGRGIDPQTIINTAVQNKIKTGEELENMSKNEILALIMRPDFSCGDFFKTSSDNNTRGRGLDLVRKNIEKLNGTITIDSQPLKGTCIHLRLPLTLAIIPCLIVAVRDYNYAVPQTALEELVCLYDEDIHKKIEQAGSHNLYRLRKQLLPMIRLTDVLENQVSFQNKSNSLTFAVVKTGDLRFGLIVDKVIGTEEIVVKPMHPFVADIGIYCGSAIMGDGRAALILDVEGIARYSKIYFNAPGINADKDIKKIEHEKISVLLFKLGKDEQFALPLPLIKRVEQISVSDIEIVGNKEFITIDNKSTRIVFMDRILNVSPCIKKEKMFFIIPRNAKKPVGFLISEIIDTVGVDLDMNMETHMEEGLKGTALVNGKMTLFPDIFRLAEME